MRKKEENNMKDSAPEQVRHRVAEVSFRPSVPRLKMASTVARSEQWEYWTQRVASGAEFDVICDM